MSTSTSSPVPHLTSEDEEDIAVEEKEEAGNGASKTSTNKQKRYVASSSKGPQGDVKFPIRLHEMLHDVHQSSSLTEIVSWNPDGTAFKVHNKSQFETVLLPKYFLQTKYRSFQRQLNHYGFERIANGGAFDGGYKHADFVRDDSGKCHAMRRLKREPLLRRVVAASSRSSDSHPCDYPRSPFPSTQHRQPLVVSPDASIGRPIAQPILVGNNTPPCHNYCVTLPPHPFSAPVAYHHHHHHHPPVVATYPTTTTMMAPPPPAYPASYVVSSTPAHRPTARGYLPGGYQHPPPTAVVTPPPQGAMVPTAAATPSSDVVTYVYLTPPPPGAVVVPGTSVLAPVSTTTTTTTNKVAASKSDTSSSPPPPSMEEPKRGMVLCDEEDLRRPPNASPLRPTTTLGQQPGRQVSTTKTATADPLLLKPSCLSHRDRSISLRSTNSSNDPSSSVNDLLLDFLDEQAAHDDGLLGAVWISQGNNSNNLQPPPSLSTRMVSMDEMEDPPHNTSTTTTTTTQMVAL